MSKSWPAKDPSAVLDYVYRIPLDASDSVASVSNVTLTKLAGTATIQSQSLASPNTTSDGYGQDFTVWLSGGADGETDVFKIAWTTVQTRSNDDIITLPIVANAQLVALDLLTYTPPLPGHLVARYPAFANVSTATIQAWLTDAQRFVSTCWRPGDYPIAIMALAAHNMAVGGLVTDSGTAQIPAGVSRFKMGPVEFQLTDQAANAKFGGDLTATRYGVEFQALQRANFAGPRVAPSGVSLDSYYPDVWVL